MYSTRLIILLKWSSEQIRIKYKITCNLKNVSFKQSFHSKANSPQLPSTHLIMLNNSFSRLQTRGHKFISLLQELWPKSYLCWTSQLHTKHAHYMYLFSRYAKFFSPSFNAYKMIYYVLVDYCRNVNIDFIQQHNTRS